MPGRTYTAGTAYRYGFNGKEQDSAINGNGVDYDYGFRIYDARIGKFLSIDPLTIKYPELTPYQFASNTPIQAIDLDGLEMKAVNRFTGETANGPLNLSNFPAQNGWIVTSTVHQAVYGYTLNPLFSQPMQTKATVKVETPIANVHSEAPPLAIKQAKARANMMVLPPSSQSYANRATLRPTPPQGPANDFEAGAVTGVQMATVGVMSAYCPGCLMTMGGVQTYNGIKDGDALEIGTGIFNMAGGSLGMYSRSLSLGISQMSGSGPASGVLEVSNDIKSVGTFKNYTPSNPIEFVYDPINNKFLVGKPNQSMPGLSGHQQLVKVGGFDPNTVVGGMFNRGVNGEIITNEFSGHYYQNWNDNIRKAFKAFLEQKTGQNVSHTP